MGHQKSARKIRQRAGFIMVTHLQSGAPSEIARTSENICVCEVACTSEKLYDNEKN